jgi:colanic acid biosynthesis glycosyl transferase WcaI
VLIIGQYFPPDLGGAATRVYNAAQGLVMNGCNVTVVTAFPHYPHGKIPRLYKYKPFKVEWVGKIRVIRTFILPLESKGLFSRLLLFGSFVFSSLSVLAIIGRVDVIWAANPDVFVLVPSITYGTLKKKPVVSNVDDLIIEDLYDLNFVKRGSLISKIAEFFARVLFAKVKAVTPISPAYIETITRYGVDKSKIHVIRGGVDLDVFKPCESKSDVNRKFVVLYSGGFSIAYDFEQIFKAAKIIEDFDDVEFVVQGKGELLDSMRSKVNELNLKNVQIIDKLLSRESVGKLLGQADVLILPLADFKTPYRGMSSKLYEYQAVAKPIICCSRGLPRAYVKKTNSGLVVYPADYEALAKAVIELKRNPSLARMMGENGRKYVETEASIEAIGLRIKGILQQASRTTRKCRL